jgi:hypothetical protein
MPSAAAGPASARHREVMGRRRKRERGMGDSFY